MYEAANKERLIFALPSIVERFAWSLKKESMDDLTRKSELEEDTHRASESKLAVRKLCLLSEESS